MNARGCNFVKVGGSLRAARFLGGAAAAALLAAMQAGCVGDIASVKADPRSPVAADVARLATADKDYPRFRDIPVKPADAPPPELIADRARALEAERDQLDRATAPNTWTLSNTNAFAAKARTDAGPDLGAPASSDTEGFAATARERATPPPPGR
jgi:hypothetical protein